MACLTSIDVCLSKEFCVLDLTLPAVRIPPQIPQFSEVKNISEVQVAPFVVTTLSHVIKM